MSKRIALTDGSGRWFSHETAEYFEEDTYWNGHNWISKATGEQFEHQGIYRTKGGRFILATFFDWAKPNTFEEISNEEAAIWFSKQGFDPHPACEKEFNELEIE